MPGQPDLIIESFSAPATATQSEMISQKINVVVKNIGGSEAKDFIVAVILKGTVLNLSWPTQYHILGFGTVASLKAGQSAAVTMQNFSAGTIVLPKQYEICAIADEGKKVNESDEKNNMSKCQFIDIIP
jgi:subtilase family serine protease